MKIKKLVEFFIKVKLSRLAYFLLSLLSIFLGKFSTFRLLQGNLWLQKQNGTFFIDYTPNYRLNGAEFDSFSEDIFFYDYEPQHGDVCIDIGAGLGVDTRLMSRKVGSDGKVFSKPEF